LPIFDLADPDVAQHVIDLSRDVFALVKSLNGNMSADHSDGIIRTPFVPDFYPSSHEAFIALKCLFDPAGILNPGKKVGGTEGDIKKYIVTL
jgi:FAD/FMN-containing dehydrogenase